MFSNKSSIIIVDNNEAHIETLNKVFIENQIKCTCHIYDTFEKVANPSKDVRIAFFDINLRDLPTNNEAEIFNELANALNDYISVENGPYALVFWTQNKELIPAFVDYINERRPETPKPYNIQHIDKDQFVNIAGEDLKTTLELVFEHPSINLFLEYEKNVRRAATETLRKLYNIIPTSSWGDNGQFEDNFEAIFSKIAIQQLGLKFAQREPDKAIYESLSPILHNQINQLAQDSWKKKLKKLAKANVYGDVKYPEGFKQSELNTLFHIDFETQKYSMDARGLVFHIENEIENSNSFFKMPFSEWVQLVTRIKPAKYEEIKKDISLVAIEISSACDFSQDKRRLNKYIFGLKTPLLSKKDTNSSFLESTFNFDYAEFGFSDSPFLMYVNFNYVFSAATTEALLNKPIFLLKKEIMDSVGNRYASYVSRIGITSF